MCWGVTSISAIAIIGRSLDTGVDPYFGAPLSPAETDLWESILLGAKRRRRTWREFFERLGISLFQPGGNPFGASSGGAGGNVSTAETGGATGNGKSFGNSFPWLYPTGDFRNFDKYGTVLLPATGAANIASIGGTLSNLVITNNSASNMPWFVPPRFNGFIKTIALDFVANGGAAWTQGALPQQLQFGLYVNQNPVFDYAAFAFSPGLVNAPSPIAGIHILEQNLVQMFVTNLTLVNTTQYVEARLQGYYYGKQFWPKDLAFAS